MWNNYKINKTISLDNTIIIKSAFDFHLSTNNHVLFVLFYGVR